MSLCVCVCVYVHTNVPVHKVAELWGEGARHPGRQVVHHRCGDEHLVIEEVGEGPGPFGDGPEAQPEAPDVPLGAPAADGAAELDGGWRVVGGGGVEVAACVYAQKSSIKGWPAGFVSETRACRAHNTGKRPTHSIGRRHAHYRCRCCPRRWSRGAPGG